MEITKFFALKYSVIIISHHICKKNQFELDLGTSSFKKKQRINIYSLTFVSAHFVNYLDTYPGTPNNKTREERPYDNYCDEHGKN